MPGHFLILQAAAAAALSPSTGERPTIELRARVHADSIRVERQGEARLEVYADPPLDRHVTVDRSKPVPNGATVRNVTITLDAAATIAPDGDVLRGTQTTGLGAAPVAEEASAPPGG